MIRAASQQTPNDAIHGVGIFGRQPAFAGGGV
jgi:hypothetical protein